MAGAVLALLVGVAGCGLRGDDEQVAPEGIEVVEPGAELEPEPDSAPEREGTEPEPTDGVLIAWQDLRAFDPGQLGSSDGTLTVVACRWLGPRRWEVRLNWESETVPSVEEAVNVPILVGYGEPEGGVGGEVAEGPAYGAMAGVATLSGNGTFSVPVTGSVLLGLGDRLAGYWQIDPGLQYPPTGRCSGEVLTDDTNDPAFDKGIEVSVEPIAASRPVPDDDTVEALAAMVEPTIEWRSHPLAPLALLITHDDIPVDRFYLAPDVPITTIDIKNLGHCVIVTTTQTTGTVLQSLGCDGGEVPDPVDGEPIVDDRWQVRADGQAGFADAVRRLRFEGGVEPAQAPALNDETRVLLGIAPRAAADGGDERDDFVGANTVDVYDWQGDAVTIWADLGQDYCCVIYEAEAETFNGASVGQACRDWFVAVHDDGTRGFVLVVVHGDRTATLDVDSQAQQIPLAPARVDGLRAAVVDAPFDFSTSSDYLQRVNVFEPDGTLSPCIQE